MKKTFIIKRCLIILMVLSMMFNTGCWNRKELKELGVVGSVAVDTDGEKIKLTYEVIVPKKLESVGTEDKSALFLESEGDSVFDAIRNATLKFNKKLYWPHANIIYFSEDCAENGLKNYMDLFNRDHDLRKYIHLLIVKDTPAYEIMNNEWQEGVIPSLYVENIIHGNTASGKIASVKILDFLKTYYTEGIEPVIGAISITENSNSNSRTNSKDGEENEEEDADDKLPLVEGLYAFRDDRLVGYLNGVQTRSYNIITNNIKSGIIITDSPDKNGLTSMEIKKSSSSLDVKWENGELKGTVAVKILGSIGEETGLDSITKSDATKDIEQLTAEEIKLQLEDCISRVQHFGTDIFGFGRAFHIKNPDEWKTRKDYWNVLFTDMDVEVNVEVAIDKIGVSNEQIGIKEKDTNAKD